MDKLGDFLKGVAASKELLQNAWKKGCFIECVCLESNQIDALLRMGLILTNQIESTSSQIDEKYLYQGEFDKTISEKQIYELAKEKEVINESFRYKLYSLYSERNKVIHRYIISGITTNRLLEIALDYKKQKEELNTIIIELEKEQIAKGVGMTKSGTKEMSEKVPEMIAKMSKEKHGI